MERLKITMTTSMKLSPPEIHAGKRRTSESAPLQRRLPAQRHPRCMQFPKPWRQVCYTNMKWNCFLYCIPACSLHIHKCIPSKCYSHATSCRNINKLNYEGKHTASPGRHRLITKFSVKFLQVKLCNFTLSFHFNIYLLRKRIFI